MALPATDAFTGVNGTQLTAYSANWTLNNGDFDIQSNAICGDYADLCIAHWNADTFNNNQYSQAKLSAASITELMGPVVRCAASAYTAYLVQYYGNVWREMGKVVAGEYTTLAATGAPAPPSVGTVLRLEANGTTITPKLNGSTDAVLGAKTDASIASGYAGICGTGDVTTTALDDWEGGDLAGVAAFVFKRNWQSAILRM